MKEQSPGDYINVVCDKLPSFKMFKDYSDSLELTIETFRNILKRREFAKWYQTIVVPPVGFFSMLMLPLGHALRYDAYLQGLLQFSITPTERQLIEQTQEVMSQFSSTIKTQKKTLDNKMKIEAIANQLTSSVPLDLKDLWYIHDSPLAFVHVDPHQPHRRTMGHVYLFSDRIIVSHSEGGAHTLTLKRSEKDLTSKHWVGTIELNADVAVLHGEIDSVAAKKRLKIGLLNTIDISSQPDCYIAPTVFSSLLKPGTYPHVKIDEVQKGAENNLLCDAYSNIFRNEFMNTKYFTYVGWEGEGDADPFVINVSLSSTKGEHRALKTNKRGYKEFTVPDGRKDRGLEERIAATLIKMEKPHSLYPLQDQRFIADFIIFEHLYSQEFKQFKIGVVYCKSGQTDPHQMLLNGINGDNISTSFWAFMHLMGSEIDLSTWKGYRGDMGNKGQSFFESWNNHEVMFHVAPMLDSEGHRRLIGNDLAIIFFLEEGGQFDLTSILALGQMPVIFVVVQPEGGSYKVAFISAASLKATKPLTPATALDGMIMKDTVLTKIYNGIAMTQYCPPTSRLFFRPRGDWLKDLVKRFPERKSSTTLKKLITTVSALPSATLMRTGQDSSDGNDSWMFELLIHNESAWKFYASGKAEYECWVTLLNNALRTRKLQIMLEEISNEAQPNSPLLDSAASSGKDSDKLGRTTASNNIVIISAHYGKLGPSAKDVTKQVQDIVKTQGGGKLELKEGSKRNLFEPGARPHHHVYLVIVYIDSDGAKQRKSFKDEEAVFI